jgi:valyl-tRNA synthetase
MSKSLGNITNPLDMIAKYGADAVRLSLIMGAAPGNDIRLDENRIRGYKNFANKVWNIARFVLESAQAADADASAPIAPEDESIVAEAHAMAAGVAKHIDAFRLDLAADTAYQFIWSRFADEILEESKPLIKGADRARAASRAAALLNTLDIILKALHPFMPFVTEEVWGDMPSRQDLLMVEPWPAQG